jgi:signal peptidase
MRRLLGWIGAVATIAAVIVWTLWLRPAWLGGPAAYIYVAGTSMEPTMHTGDLVVTQQAPSYRIGDVVAYPVPEGQPGEGVLVIHRIVGGSASAGYVVQGDNRDAADLWRPTAGEIAGREWIHLPGFATWIAALRSPLALALFAGVVAFLVVAGHAPKERTLAAEPAPPAQPVSSGTTPARAATFFLS